ncbi:hypothetical protein [Pyrococcus sp.]|uniref:hypothetical protein n=1 Tax=Pyrococcus sp. TaxID=33866 RepID=UPI00258544F1|nr:hypothetical protein [Pyrococcus sp.]
MAEKLLNLEFTQNNSYTRPKARPNEDIVPSAPSETKRKRNTNLSAKRTLWTKVYSAFLFTIAYVESMLYAVLAMEKSTNSNRNLNEEKFS